MSTPDRTPGQAAATAVRWDSTPTELSAVEQRHLDTYFSFVHYCGGTVLHSQESWLRKRRRLGLRAIQKTNDGSHRLLTGQYVNMQGFKPDEGENPAFSFTPPTMIDLPDPVVVEPNCIILADMHIPYVDYGWLAEALDCAKLAGVDTVIHAGDVLDMAQFFKPDMSSVSIKAEIDAARDITKWISDCGFRQVYLPGNHEARINRITNGQIGMWVFGDYLQGTCEITELAWVEIRGFGRVCHPGNYSKVQLSVPTELAYNHECGIISTHTHHAATGWSRSGRHQVVEAGIIADPKRAYYKKRVMTPRLSGSRDL